MMLRIKRGVLGVGPMVCFKFMTVRGRPKHLRGFDSVVYTVLLEGVVSADLFERYLDRVTRILVQPAFHGYQLLHEYIG